MSRPGDDMPERMRAGGTELERRLLSAGAHEEPSEELSSRMAAAIGVSTAALGTAAIAKATSAVAGKTMALKGGASVLWPWLSFGAIAVVAVGTIIGTRMVATGTTDESQPALTVPPPVASLPPTVEPVSGMIEIAPRGAIEPPNPSTAMANRTRTMAVAGDLRDQIAMMDVARGALAVGNGPRAMEVLRRYQEKYPAGSFRPEATALKIEALSKLGRKAEARALAERFVSENKGTPLAERVARIAGLARP